MSIRQRFTRRLFTSKELTGEYGYGASLVADFINQATQEGWIMIPPEILISPYIAGHNDIGYTNSLDEVWTLVAHCNQFEEAARHHFGDDANVLIQYARFGRAEFAKKAHELFDL